ncbi:2235_t:CDS:1, partial [Dentiscutata heterogama]
VEQLKPNLFNWAYKLEYWTYIFQFELFELINYKDYEVAQHW